MNAALVSVRYASALFKAGEKDGSLLETLDRDCRLLLDSLKQSKELESFLASPVVKPQAKKDILNKAFGGKLHDYTLRFLELLINNNRASILKYTLMDFTDMFRSFRGIKKVKVITAIELTDTLRTELLNILEKQYRCNVELECKVEPDIIGGMILIVDGRQADGSVSGQLRALKKQLMIK